MQSYFTEQNENPDNSSPTVSTHSTDISNNKPSYLDITLTNREDHSSQKIVSRNTFPSFFYQPAYFIKSSLPEHIADRIREARYLLASESLENALTLCNELNKIMPNQCEILVMISRCYKEMKQYKTAMNFLEQAERIALRNNHEEDLTIVYQAYFFHYNKTLDHNKAKIALTKIPNQNDFNVLRYWIQFYLDYTDFSDNPQEQVEKAAEKFNQITQQPVKYSSRQKLIIDLAFQDIRINQKIKIDPDQVFHLLNKLKTTNNISLGTKTMYFSNLLFALKNTTIYTLKEKDKILSAINTVIIFLRHKYPKSFKLDTIEALILIDLDPKKSENKYQHILNRYPNEWSEYLNYTYLLIIRQAEYKTGIDFILKSLEKESSSQYPHPQNRRKQWLAAMQYYLAYAYLELGDVKQATKAIKESISNNSNFRKSRTYSCRSLLGKCQIDPIKGHELFNLARQAYPEGFEINHPQKDEMQSKVNASDSLSNDIFLPMQNVSAEDTLAANTGWGRWSDDELDNQNEVNNLITTLNTPIQDVSMTETLDTGWACWEEDSLLEDVTLGLQPAISSDPHDIEFLQKFLNTQHLHYASLFNYNQKQTDDNEDPDIKNAKLKK